MLPVEERAYAADVFARNVVGRGVVVLHQIDCISERAIVLVLVLKYINVCSINIRPYNILLAFPCADALRVGIRTYASFTPNG